MKNKKLSIVMAYHNRPVHLRNTLESYSELYNDIKDDFEIIIVDDSSEYEDDLLEVVADFNLDIKTKYIDRIDKEVRNPCVPYNIAISMASGDYVNLTNPENAHIKPILKHALDHMNHGKYLVYGCLNLRTCPPSYKDLMTNLKIYTYQNLEQAWYQHSRFKNRLLHFCTVINRDELIKIGGFDERFADGSGYDDNDLIQTIVSNDILVDTVDDYYCGHQDHARSWDEKSTMYNYRILHEKWGCFPISSWEKGREKEQLEEAARVKTRLIQFGV